MPDARPSARAPLAWIPSLYLAEGLPYVAVMTVSVALYKRLGVSNTDIGLYTSLLYLPWMLKPLWSPIVDLVATRRRWTWVMQSLVVVAFAGIAFTIPLPSFFAWTLAWFWLLAFTSATHDIAADGFYMLANDSRQQALYVGVRSLFYRIAMMVGQGPLVILAGVLEPRLGVPRAWSVTFGLLAVLFALFALWHRFVLPRPAADRPGEAAQAGRFVREFLATFGSFFRRPGIAVVLLFLLLYRLGESQLAKMTAPFLLDPREAGGMGLTTAEFGWVYGTVGIASLIAGGLLGGWAASRHGLRAWLWPMLFAINAPDVLYLYLASAQPQGTLLVQVCVAVEQFGYGFGFTAYMLYMMYVSRGDHPTAHYSICTGFMAMGMMLPGMWSGWLQERVGYVNFYWVVLASTLPGFLVALFLRIEPDFGRRREPA